MKDKVVPVYLSVGNVTGISYYSRKVQLAKNNFARTGYMFAGWNRNKCLDCTTYEDEGIYEIKYNTFYSWGSKDVLYAVWSQ